MLAPDIPPDHPDLDPIWRAAADHGLPIAHHSSTWNPPYYPGYRDVWENIFLGRMASHPWGAMRFVASFIGGGIFDRYPDLRLAVLEWALAGCRSGRGGSTSRRSMLAARHR
jgi:predicted TIM-barrel fold metal-dependent hydrolase